MSTPEWLVWHPDGGEEEADGRRINASDAEYAAQRWAERYDSNGDGLLRNGDSEEIMVKGSDGVVTKFRVGAEPSVQYYARELL